MWEVDWCRVINLVEKRFKYKSKVFEISRDDEEVDCITYHVESGCIRVNWKDGRVTIHPEVDFVSLTDKAIIREQ